VTHALGQTNLLCYYFLELRLVPLARRYVPSRPSPLAMARRFVSSCLSFIRMTIKTWRSFRRLELDGFYRRARSRNARCSFTSMILVFLLHGSTSTMDVLSYYLFTLYAARLRVRSCVVFRRPLTPPDFNRSSSRSFLPVFAVTWQNAVLYQFNFI